MEACWIYLLCVCFCLAGCGGSSGESSLVEEGPAITLSEPITTRVTVEPKAPPLALALERVLQNFNYVVGYAPSSERIRSVRVLGPKWQPATEDVLTNLALTDPDQGVRINAVDRLRDGKTFAVALADQDPSVRMEAVEALTVVEPGTALELLAYALSDPNEAVREAAVETLGQIDGGVAVALLESALQDVNPLVREEAVYALANQQGRAAARLLETALGDLDVVVAETAARALEKR